MVNAHFALFFQKFFQKFKNGQLFLSIFLILNMILKKKIFPPMKKGVLDDNAHKTHFLYENVVTINFFTFFTNFMRLIFELFMSSFYNDAE